MMVECDECGKTFDTKDGGTCQETWSWNVCPECEAQWNEVEVGNDNQ